MIAWATLAAILKGKPKTVPSVNGSIFESRKVSFPDIYMRIFSHHGFFYIRKGLF